MKPYHLTTTCLKTDPPHSNAAMHAAVNVDKMDGFVKGATDRQLRRPLRHGLLRQHRSAILLFLANTFAIGDHTFSSVRGSTWPNRDYLLVATSDGVKDTGGGHPAETLPTSCPSSTRKASPGAPTRRRLLSKSASAGRPITWACTTKRLSRLRSRTARSPRSRFIDSREGIEDEHPAADVQVGEAWTRDIYAAGARKLDLAHHRAHLHLRRGGRIRRSRPSAQLLSRRARQMSGSPSSACGCR